MDEYALVGSSAEGGSKSVGLERARRMALKHIETFVLTFADPQAFSAAALSSAPAPLAQVIESARILEAGHLRCRYSLFSYKGILVISVVCMYVHQYIDLHQ